MVQPQVAFSTGFFEAFSRLPKAEQKRVRAFVEKFKQDPTQAAINYEKLEGMRDDKVRTVRIGQAYRAVVIHPPRGDVYLCVWVDHHDEAMGWARRKRFEVNPVTGSMQVYEERYLDETAASTKAEPAREEPTVESRRVPEGRLFGGREVEDILLLGVPEPLLPAVVALRTEYDLDDLARYLPADAADGLYLVAAGYDVGAALDELARAKEPKTVDVQDFGTAIANEGSQGSFALIEDDDELAAILDAPLERWRVFLHPSQRRIAEMGGQGSARVLGGAGTGKTVVALHRARFIARDKAFLGPGEKVLFTTFTRNLAVDINAQLDGLCGPERERIEVTHLHALAAQVVRTRSGVAPSIANRDVLRDAWQGAMTEVYPSGSDDFTLEFIEDEWQQVIQAQDVLDEREYLKARRDGRGRRLSRAERKALYGVVDAFRTRLEDQGLVTYGDVVREARLLLEADATRPYRAVVADEVQDMSLSELRLLRALVSEGKWDLFLVGDAHQRIYGRPTSLGRAGIKIRGRQGRRLRLAYRTTQAIHRWATGLFEGATVDDLDEGVDEGTEYRALRQGLAPIIAHHADADAELRALLAQVAEWRERKREARDIVVVAPTKKLRDACGEALKAAGHKVFSIKRDADRGSPDAVRVATIHRVKGLEFPFVYLVGAQSLVGRQRVDDSGEGEVEGGGFDRNRNLLYVAATRARDELVVSSSGALRPSWVGHKTPRPRIPRADRSARHRFPEGG